MQTDQLPKLELDGFNTSVQDIPLDVGWRKKATEIAKKAGVKIQWKKQKPDDDIDIGYKRLLVKTGICAAVAIAILVISAVSPSIGQQLEATTGDTLSQEFDIPEDIGKLKFVEKLDDEAQSVMSVLPDSAVVIPSDGEVVTTFGQAGSSGVRFSADGQTAYCLARATVTAVGEVDGQGYVRLVLDTGETVLYYNIEPLVLVDDIVQPGQIVGTVSGDYLYVEMKDGEEYIDPMAYINGHTATLQQRRMKALRIGRLKINLLLIPAVAALVLLGMGEVLLCYVPAVLLHEWAHVLAATALGMTITELELLPFGCAARLQCFAMSRAKEIVVAAAGPAANMLFACAVFAVNRYAMPIAIADKLIAANLALASINMLPALPLDGGRIARAAFAGWMGYPRATRLTAIAGIVFAVVLTGMGIYTLILGQVSPSLFVMGFFLCLAAIKELKSAPFTLIRDFSGKRVTIERKRTLSVNRIAAMQGEHIGDVLRAFEAGKYNVVTVLRGDMGVMAELDEREILSGMMRVGTGATLGSLCRQRNADGGLQLYG